MAGAASSYASPMMSPPTSAAPVGLDSILHYPVGTSWHGADGVRASPSSPSSAPARAKLTRGGTLATMDPASGGARGTTQRSWARSERAWAEHKQYVTAEPRWSPSQGYHAYDIGCDDALTYEISRTGHIQHGVRLERAVGTRTVELDEYMDVTAPKRAGKKVFHRGSGRSRYNTQAIRQRSDWVNGLRARPLGSAALSRSPSDSPRPDLPPPPPMLRRPMYFEAEMEQFQDLTGQCEEAEQMADHYRDSVEHIIQDVLAIKRTVAMLPRANALTALSPKAPQSARQQQMASSQRSQEELRSCIEQATGHIRQTLLPQLFQAAHLQERAEISGRNISHLSKRLRASQHVLAAYQERESFLQSAAAELDDEEWEDAQHLISTFAQVLLPHLSNLEILPEERRTPAEAMAIRILLSASAGAE